MSKKFEPVELRQMVDGEVFAVIDAIAKAKGIRSTRLIDAILKAWVARKVHEATFLQNLTEGNVNARKVYGLTGNDSEDPGDWSQTGPATGEGER